MSSTTRVLIEKGNFTKTRKAGRRVGLREIWWIKSGIGSIFCFLKADGCLRGH